MITLVLPNFFGNPAHHRVFDVFSRQWAELAGTTEWGIKNYVEGGVYLGILPFFLEVTVPTAMLLAVLIALGRLSADSEIVALRASGVSLMQIARPIAVFVALTWAATSLLSDTALCCGGEWHYAPCKANVRARSNAAAGSW